eukprot:4298316-Pleurochrysis_carterae.AAC.2
MDLTTACVWLELSAGDQLMAMMLRIVTPKCDCASSSVRPAIASRSRKSRILIGSLFCRSTCSPGSMADDEPLCDSDSRSAALYVDDKIESSCVPASSKSYPLESMVTVIKGLRRAMA